MATIATLTFDLVAESAKLRTDLQKASRSTKSWADQTRKRVDVAAKAFAGLTVAAGVTMAAIYVSTAKTADQLGKFSDRVGEVPVKIQGLRRATELTGGSAEALDSALEKMSKRLGEAANGTGEAAKYLKEYGLNTKEFFSLSPADQFGQISDKVNQLSTQQEKAAASNAFFSRSGLGLINTMALGSKGIKDITQEVKDYGLELTRIDIAKIEAANDSWFRSREVLDGFGQQITVQLAPLIETLSNEFLNAAKEAGGMGEAATTAINVMLAPFKVVGDAVRGLHIALLGVDLVLAGLAATAVQSFGTIVKGYVEIANLLPWVEDLKYEDTIFGKAEAFANTAYEAINEKLNTVLMEKIPSQQVEEWVSDIHSKATEAAKKVADASSENIGSIFTDPAGTTDTATDYTKGLTNFQEMANQYKAVSENTSLFVEDAFARAGDAMVNNFSNGAAEAILSGKSMNEVFSSLANTLATTLLSSLIQIGVQMAINKAFSTTAKAAEIVEAGVTGTAIALAYAPAASAVSLATMGSNAVPAAAGISSTYALTAGLAATGMAHDGMDSIPREGTWLLDKGERVIPSDENKKITQAIQNGTGAANQPINIYNTYQIQSNDAASVRRAIDQVVPMIEQKTMRSVEQALRAGGSLSRAAGVR
jgi:hypothetical protein